MNKFKEVPSVSKLFWNGLLNANALPILAGALFVTIIYVYNGIKSQNFVLSGIGFGLFLGYLVFFHYRNAKKEHKKLENGI